jgi:capsular polysaccharide export protein
MSEPLREVIESFARHAPADHKLVVKLHPLDPGLRNWSERVRRLAADAGIAGRVRFLDGGALDPLVAAAAGVVTVNSTVGLRTMQLDRPVKTLGSALYDVPGLTFQGPLDAFWTGASPPDAGLRDAFVRASAALLHVRGVYYRQPGLDAAVAAAAQRLDAGAAETIDAQLRQAASADRNGASDRLGDAAS